MKPENFINIILQELNVAYIFGKENINYDFISARAFIIELLDKLEIENE